MCRSGAHLVRPLIDDVNLLLGGIQMKYMLMFAGSEEYFDAFRSFPEDVQKAALARVDHWSQEQSAAGRLLEGHRLKPSSTATTVRLQHGQDGMPNGKALITDGPFIDAKERIGGYVIIEVPDLDAAIAMAKTWPAGGTIEIRPLADLQEA
jgi:hypothetical protein